MTYNPHAAFYDASVGNWLRVALVVADTDEAAEEAAREYGEWINPCQLPNDFMNWKEYAAHADRDSITRIYSRTGD